MTLKYLLILLFAASQDTSSILRSACPLLTPLVSCQMCPLFQWPPSSSPGTRSWSWDWVVEASVPNDFPIFWAPLPGLNHAQQAIALTGPCLIITMNLIIFDVSIFYLGVNNELISCPHYMAQCLHSSLISLHLTVTPSGISKLYRFVQNGFLMTTLL